MRMRTNNMSSFIDPPKKLGFFGFIKNLITNGDDFFFLKCDTKGCIHISLYEYPHMCLINTPCPKCNANLCTEQDMIDFIANGVDVD